jgi:hypothetical protein
VSVIVCAGCGCTDQRPCVNLAGQTCRWTTQESEEAAGTFFGGRKRAGLCSFCAAKPLDELLARQEGVISL